MKNCIETLGIVCPKCGSRTRVERSKKVEGRIKRVRICLNKNCKHRKITSET